MIHLILFSEFVKVFTPHVRKNVLNIMDPEECMFLNSIIVLFICFGFLLYKICFENYRLNVTIDRYFSMNYLQIAFAMLIGIATVISSMVVLTMDKHYNTPLINGMLFKVVSVILLVVMGVLFFRETYSYRQLVGIAFIIVGGGLLFYHTDKSLQFKREHTLEWYFR